MKNVSPAAYRRLRLITLLARSELVIKLVKEPVARAAMVRRALVTTQIALQIAPRACLIILRPVPPLAAGAVYFRAQSKYGRRSVLFLMHF